MSVYTLLLENNKYYVGFTNRNVNTRFQEHLQGCGSKWTSIYKPLQLLNSIKGDLQTENQVTLEMMEKYGWKNVRGGSWCQVDLKYRPTNYIPGVVENFLEEFLGDLGSEIYNESIPYHKYIYNKLFGDIPSINNWGWISKSFDSPPITSVNIDEDYIIIDQEICTRCRRTTHLAENCYAIKDTYGNYLKL